MNATERKNAEAVSAYMERASQTGELHRTDQFFAPQIAEAFTDRVYAVDDLFAQGEKVVARILITGKHTGEFAGHAPTGRTVTVTHFREFQMADGEMIRNSGWFDTGTLLPQLQTK
ncbi:ester cyclase [Paenibacillus arenilitoris]|uniref:Ester cyclase n=1 Tax=Paenibacillus arenilitoris TaxID=2772299 RepID=A0A927H8P3_9BACL|nr:ester cyclase [Paenibacillus arenilitoris]MBD2870814.1 ester cyclase [Paenibacillus arenilitoris]